MNILYLYGNSIDPEKGGIQRVTAVLSDFFENEGHNVYYLSRMLNKVELLNKRQYYIPDSVNILDKRNIDFLKKFIVDKKVDVVINQSGMDPQISALSYHVKETNAKLVACIHNSILSPIQHFSATYDNSAKKLKLSWLLPLTEISVIKNLLLKLYKLKYSSHYNQLYEYSDKIVLLSENFKNELSFFLDSSKLEKVTAISNPVSFKNPISQKTTLPLKKQLLYVGRVDRRQKRVDILLEIWEKLHLKFPDWNMKIVGGGPDLEALKQIATAKGLTNISFEGFRDPEPYYKESSIFCMTSSYEGFGIVLVEAQAYGLVPFAFNSYLSVTDIITDGEDGVLVKPFITGEYANKLSFLMSDSTSLSRMAFQGIKKSKLFSISTIGNKWIKCLKATVLIGTAQKI